MRIRRSRAAVPANPDHSNAQPAQQDAHAAHADALAAHKLALAEERIAELKQRLDEMRRDLDRAQAGEDAWKEQCERTTRALAPPAPTDAQASLKPTDAGGPLYRAWRWMRASA